MRTFSLLLLSSAAVLASPAWAQQVPDSAEADDSAAEIIVFGRGETRQVQELGSEDLAVLAPGTSPLKAIEKLPSVNFQSADPFGNYEWSTRVTIRGFNQNQLGFNLDGIPLGDMTYGNNNGLHISRAITPENIGVTRVAQGSGSLGTQSTNNLGGTLEFFSLDPKDGFGGDINLTYGTEDTARVFGRVTFGEADQARGFISGMYQTADKWKGDGKQGGWMINAKGILPIGGAELDAYFSRSDRAEQDYQDLSLGMITRLGYDWDNFGPRNYALAVQVADIGTNRGETGATVLNPGAGTVYPAPIATVDDAYYDASGLRKDTLAALGLKVPLGEALMFKIKGYRPSAQEGQPGEKDAPGKLDLFVESTDKAQLNYADNLTVAPNGHVIICEDQDDKLGPVDNHIRAVTPDGSLYAIARLRTDSELAGVCFSPDGRTMFVNVYQPGKTLAITGPWDRLA